MQSCLQLRHRLTGGTSRDCNNCIKKYVQFRFLGTCIDGVANYTCSCDEGWDGRDCDVEELHTASFSSEGGYVRFSNTNADWTKLSFQFRTTIANGVLLYAAAAATSASTNFFGLELVNRELVVHAGGNNPVTLSTRTAGEITNSEWHSVVLVKQTTGGAREPPLFSLLLLLSPPFCFV